MPYLRYAFQHVLHRNLDITPYIQRVLDSSTSKSGSYTDGDDLVFERVFFAIERRHQDLPAELNDFTENLECLALFLIRRAQEKGPYRLLGRDIPPSDAWKKYESERITQVAAKNVKVMQNQNQPIVPKYSVPTDTGPPAPPAPNMARVPLLTNNCIDPRLLYAYPGQFTSPELSGTLTLTDLQYYHRRNQEIEASVAMELAQLLNPQQRHEMQRSVPDSQTIPQVYQQNRISSLRQGHRNGASDQPRAEKALNPKAITQVQKVFMKAAAERVAATKINAVGEDKMKQNKENAERIVKLPDQQTIMVPAPSHQNNWDTYMATPGVGSFGSHPAYSNIMSSFPSPQLHGPLLAPTPTSKREE
ncbi:unnamed protein product [Alternaria alternata]